MNRSVDTLPGLAPIRTRFLTLLDERQKAVASHILAGWDNPQAAEVRSHLEAVQSTLHLIAGSAGSLGFGELGERARDGENCIVAHLSREDADDMAMSVEIMNRVDAFMTACKTVLSER